VAWRLDRFDRLDELAELAWFNEDEWDPQVCLTLVEGADADEVLRRFGGDPAAARLRTGDEAWDEWARGKGRIHGFVGVGTVSHDGAVSAGGVGGVGGGIVFAIEQASSSGFARGVLRSLSRGGRALNLDVHVPDAMDVMTYAVDGEIVVSHDLRKTPVTALAEGDPRWNPAWVEGVSERGGGNELSGAEVLLIAQRVMGVRISVSWFTRELRTCEIPNPAAFAGPHR
jgi:hypothetical protein